MLMCTGFIPELGAGGATPALGSDYGSETPYHGGLGLGATPAGLTSGAVQENGNTVRLCISPIMCS
jgi:hypothetical protein